MKFKTDGYKKLATELGNIPKALFAMVQGLGKVFVGGAGMAGGAAGGLLGFANNTLNTGAKIVGNFFGAKIALVQKFPIISAAIAGVAAYSGIKGWMHRREVRNDMLELRAANNLASAQLGNAGLAEQLSDTEALAAARRKTSAEAGTVNPARQDHVAGLQAARDVAQQSAATAPAR